MSANTRRAYASDLGAWERWCVTHGATPLPATGDDLVSHLADMAAASASESALNRRIAALVKAHRLLDLTPPDTSRAREAVKAHRRRQADAKVRPRSVAPLEPADLARMVDTLDLHSLRGRRDRALLLLGFSIAARRSELADLDLGDVMTTEDGLAVTIYRRKTGHVHTVGVPYGQHTLTCPVRAWAVWSAAAAMCGHERADQAAFPRIARGDVIAGVVAGRGSSDGHMTGAGISTVIKRIAKSAGLETDHIGGHSLRRGMATAAHRAGADHLAIARQGGWRDGSRQVFRYIEEAGIFDANPLRGIGL